MIKIGNIIDRLGVTIEGVVDALATVLAVTFLIGDALVILSLSVVGMRDRVLKRRDELLSKFE